MSHNPLLKETPWDAETLAIPTYELTEYSAEALQTATHTPGHHTTRVSSLADKRLLHEYGFYYCDTLLRPICRESRLRVAMHPSAKISETYAPEDLLQICRTAFSHGRFHRDFNISRDRANMRYARWLGQLIDSGQVYALSWDGVIAGFIAYSKCDLVLHAVADEFRGKGLSKHWWSAVCLDMFAKGCEHVTSSVSAANVAALNLYASLGFILTEPSDLYHRLTPPSTTAFTRFTTSFPNRVNQ